MVPVDPNPMTVPRLHAPFASGNHTSHETVLLQTPFTGGGSGFALQTGLFAPPLRPVHDHVQGPDPDTAVGVPALQRFITGTDARV